MWYKERIRCSGNVRHVEVPMHTWRSRLWEAFQSGSLPRVFIWLEPGHSSALYHRAWQFHCWKPWRKRTNTLGARLWSICGRIPTFGGHHVKALRRKPPGSHVWPILMIIPLMISRYSSLFTEHITPTKWMYSFTLSACLCFYGPSLPALIHESTQLISNRPQVCSSPRLRHTSTFFHPRSSLWIQQIPHLWSQCLRHHHEPIPIILLCSRAGRRG